ncbi:universal stress protein [Lacticaseibacillus baoqingensis]|uniref:Universal stress protein n=1 Tax=Lacticaseibacillus baoqingensis TaxID=2486013 RepID=A0ABW4E5B0_9LACO|nr:universal stress protein [Lacticaseibacillus baoqingensis]
MTTKRILVALDGSEAADRALARAVGIAKEQAWGIDLLQVIDTRQYTSAFGQTGSVDGKLLHESEQRVEKHLQEITAPLAATGLDIKPHIRFGSPRAVIAFDATKDYQTGLIVIGRSSKKMVTRMFIGSVASFVVENAPCDVLIVANPNAN